MSSAMLADASITTVAAVAAILASLGIGGVVGALATGWLAQKDKFRERTIAGCDEFLETESHARELLFNAERALLRRRDVAELCARKIESVAPVQTSLLDPA